MDHLTLYTNPRSRGRIARWMIEETGQPYDVVVLDFGTTMKAPDYLAINPMGKVPAITHGVHVVTEAAAICAYLAEAFPDAGLMAEDRASYFRWMFFAAGPLEAAVTDRSLGVDIPQARESSVGYGSYDHMVSALKGRLSQSAFIAGPKFSAADVYVGAQIGWGLRFGTLPKEPEFLEYSARLSSRPAALRAEAADNALMTS